MKKYDAVLFDFDGTVIDSGEGIVKSVEHALLTHGLEIGSREKLRYFIGPSLFRSFKDMYDADEDLCLKLIDTYRERYNEKGLYECSLYEGIMPLISELKENCIKVGIASAKPTFFIFKMISNFGLTDVFDTIVGTELEARNANKGELIMTALEKLGVDEKPRVVMVGDRSYDIKGAKAAGIDSIGVLYGYGTEAELRTEGATYIVKDIAALKERLL